MVGQLPQAGSCGCKGLAQHQMHLRVRQRQAGRGRPAALAALPRLPCRLCCAWPPACCCARCRPCVVAIRLVDAADEGPAWKEVWRRTVCMLCSARPSTAVPFRPKGQACGCARRALQVQLQVCSTYTSMLNSETSRRPVVLHSAPLCVHSEHLQLRHKQLEILLLARGSKQGAKQMPLQGTHRGEQACKPLTTAAARGHLPAPRPAALPLTHLLLQRGSHLLPLAARHQQQKSGVHVRLIARCRQCLNLPHALPRHRAGQRCQVHRSHWHASGSRLRPTAVHGQRSGGRGVVNAPELHTAHVLHAAD